MLVLKMRPSAPDRSTKLTVEAISSVLQNTSAAYQRYTNGAISFVAEVREIGGGTFFCDEYSESERTARDLATQAGIDLTAYQHVIIYVPLRGCAFAAQGNGGTPQMPSGTILVNDAWFTVGVLVHEFGHNFGLSHAAETRCPVRLPQLAKRWPTACTYGGDYGDPSSPMGRGYLRNVSFSTPELYYLGLIPRDRIALNPNGPVELTTLAAASGVRAVVFNAPDGRGTYWVEYRVKRGADRGLCGGSQVQVRYVGDNPGADNILIDLRRRTPSACDAGLQINGTRFTDHTGTLSIRLVSRGESAHIVARTAVQTIPVPPLVVTHAEHEENYLYVSFENYEPYFNVDRFSTTATLVDGRTVTTTQSAARGRTAMYLGDVPDAVVSSVVLTAHLTDGRTVSSSWDMQSGS